jgi:hypothetical protein
MTAAVKMQKSFHFPIMRVGVLKKRAHFSPNLFKVDLYELFGLFLESIS